MGGEEMFDKAEIFALIVSAMAHDVGHCGYTNSFHIKKKDELALRYNDTSVLENYHCSLLFELINETETENIFRTVNYENYIKIRNIIITTILATDISNHRNILLSVK
jgi:hypothetical protein